MRTDVASGFLVEGKVQFDGALERGTVFRRVDQRQQREGISREIGFRDGNTAAEHDGTMFRLDDVCSVSTMFAPYGSCDQPAPGGTTSPCAFSATTGPSPNFFRTMRLVTLFMPAAATTASGTTCASTVSPSSSSSVFEVLRAASSRGLRSARNLPAGCRSALSRVRLGTRFRARSSPR